MPLVQQLKNDAIPPFSQPPTTVKQQVSAGKAQARRRWIIRTTVTLILTTALLFLFVIWRRDHMNIEANLRNFNNSAQALQNKIDKLKLLPAILPEHEKLGEIYYASNIERRYAINTSEPTIIAVGRPIHLILLKDGQCVITYQQGKVSVEWMPIAEFREVWRKQDKTIKAYEKEIFSRPPVLP